MKKTVRLFVLLSGAVLAGQACSQEHWVGEYAGKLAALEGLAGAVGDPCAVSVTTSDMFGGAFVFEIRNIDKILMETRNVQKALEKKTDSIRMMTPGASGKPAEIVFITLGADRSMKSLKLMRKWGQQHREESAVCADLTKK